MAINSFLKPAYGTDRMKSAVLNLRPGEIVEVRDEDEILATLDERGTLDGLPFMPVMREYNRGKFKVLRRADKIMVEGIRAQMRRMRDTVILEGATCNGEAQGGCRKTCLVLWKEAWLKRAEEDVDDNQVIREMRTSSEPYGKSTLPSGIFSCQSRSLMEATSPLPKWDIRRYLWDFTSGVYNPLDWFRTMLGSLSLKARILLGQAKPNKFSGELRRTPSTSLDLRPGEFVKVKEREEILQTLDYMGRNRGLEFTPEMEKYLGGTFPVLKRLDRMITDQGVMRQIANTVLLEGVTCNGKAHGGCPRDCFCLWREIWLERVNPPLTA